MLPQVEAGLLRPLLTTAQGRLKALQRLQNAAELGLRDLQHLQAWSALLGPPGMAADTVARWRGLLDQVAGDADWVAATESLDAAPRIRAIPDPAPAPAGPVLRAPGGAAGPAAVTPRSRAVLWPLLADATLVAVLLAVGLVASVTAYRSLALRAAAQERELLNAMGQSIVGAFEQQQARALEALQVTALMLSSQGGPTRAQFLAYGESLLSESSTLTLLEWQPAVRGAQLAEFERRAAAEQPGFRVVEPGAAPDEFVPARPRELHVPVLYSWPEAGAALGVDMAFDPRRMRYKLLARDAGSPFAPETFGLIRRGRAGPLSTGFAVSAPVYRGGRPAGEDEHYAAEFRMRHAQGHWVWVQSIGRVVERDVQGRALPLAGTHMDISQRKADELRLADDARAMEAANRQLRDLAIVDALTSAFNRRHFNDVSRAALADSQRGQAVALCMLDVDFFKAYNDHYGHQAGDAVLKALAQALKDGLQRSTDALFRLGGEEFGIIFSATSAEAARAFVGQLRAAIHALALPHECSPKGIVTASFGLAWWGAPTLRLTPETMYAQADAALYDAKRAGRDQIAVRCFPAGEGEEVTVVATSSPVLAPDGSPHA
ncbi:MAG: diguanylate cyclase domain-containing protein [Roseateles sp.]